MDDKFFLSLVDKFNSSAAAELDFNDGNTRLLLRKESAFKYADYAMAANAELRAEKSQSQSAEPRAQSVHLGISAHGSDEITKNAVKGEKITSPIVATFYSSPSPDAPPYVKAGSKVKAGQTLCILEAMKMMNYLEAEFDCEVIEVHASSGELVEYGQEIFSVKRT
ncbi:MAG: acetyl-CoA carboxylase biotin carboxyl carrier protein [Treponema sp.]|nr:acetyl-CoA carboxylase biotin carboxyl carrier protein [Treponema sp.]